jgi:hypothetical protein
MPFLKIFERYFQEETGEKDLYIYAKRAFRQSRKALFVLIVFCTLLIRPTTPLVSALPSSPEETEAKPVALAQ